MALYLGDPLLPFFPPGLLRKSLCSKNPDHIQQPAGSRVSAGFDSASTDGCRNVMSLQRPLLGVTIFYQQVQLDFPSVNTGSWPFVFGADARLPFKELKTKVVFDRNVCINSHWGSPAAAAADCTWVWVGDHSLQLWFFFLGQCVTYQGKHGFSRWPHQCCSQYALDDWEEVQHKREVKS